MKRTVSGILFVLLLAGVFIGAFNVQPAKANVSSQGETVQAADPDSTNGNSDALAPINGTFTTVMTSNTTAWDTASIGSPFVFYDVSAGLYKMWYTALSEPTYWSPYWVYRWVIAYAESEDGVNWVNKTVVVDTGGPSWYHTGDPWVLEENGTYLMWHMDYYEWVAGDWSSYIARMSSPDGVSWPAFMSAGDAKVLSALGQWTLQGDGNGVQTPCVIYEPGVGYVMWYSVADHYGSQSCGPLKIWRANSSDGITWSNRQLSLPYINGTWEGYVSYPSVVREDDGTYTMFYAAQSANGSTSIGMAKSLDGVAWTNRTQLLRPSDLGANVTSIGTPFQFQDVDGKRYLYFTYYDGKTKFGRVQLSNGPMPELIDPDENATINGDTELYATDQVDVMIITSATFEYSRDGSQWNMIGTDTNGTMEIDSENCTTYGIGLWNVTWSTSSLTEGSYYVRVAMTDTYGRTGQDVVSLYVDPTPPIPTITGLTDGQSVNGVVTFKAATVDAHVNETMVQELVVPGKNIISPPPSPPPEIGVPLLNQHGYGPQTAKDEEDPNWNKNSYCAPTSGASVIQYWAEHGLPKLLLDPKTGEKISINTLVTTLAATAGTLPWASEKAPGGTDFLRLRWAIEKWIESHGGGLTVSQMMPLNFANFKKELESGEVPIVTTGRHDMVGNSVDNKQDKEGDYRVDFMDPWTGIVYQTWMYPNGTFYYDGGLGNGDWVHSLLPLVRMFAVSRTPEPPGPGLPPVPQPPQNWPQWKSIPCRYEDHVLTVAWDTSLIAPNEYYLIRVSLMDTNGRSGYSIIWVFVQGADRWPMFRYDPSHDGSTTSTAPSTNQTLWNDTTGTSVESSPAISGGLVYVGSGNLSPPYNGKVYCLNATTGAFVWSYPAGVWASSPAVAGGLVYVGSIDGYFYCLNATTGAFVWNYWAGGWWWGSSPAVAGGFVYVACDSGYVYCLNATTGALVWSYPIGTSTASSPAVVGGLVYVGGHDGNVYCLNATTGAFVWSYMTGSYVPSSPAVFGGLVYVGSADEKVYCLNATTGAFVWSYMTGSYVPSSPAVFGGLVYVGSLDDNVYCLNAANGSLVWNYTTGDEVISSPAVAGNGLVYVGSYDGKVYCLTAATGSLVWSYKTGGPVYSSPAVANGVVYVGSNDGKIYAFGPLPLTVSISPMSVTMYVGQSQVFTSTVSGGMSPYSYQWYVNGASVPAATNPTWTFTPTGTGTYDIYLNVTDSTGTVALPSPVLVGVIPVTPVGGLGLGGEIVPIDTTGLMALYIALISMVTVGFAVVNRKFRKLRGKCSKRYAESL